MLFSVSSDMRAPLPRAGLLARRLVFGRRLLDFGPDDLLIGAEPIGGRHELRTVPARDPAFAAALVIGVGHGRRRDQPFGVEVADGVEAGIEPVAVDRTVRRPLERL